MPPINHAIEVLGVVAEPGRDQFETFGIGDYRTYAQIIERAR